jgi:hypothetical protein
MRLTSVAGPLGAWRVGLSLGSGAYYASKPGLLHLTRVMDAESRTLSDRDAQPSPKPIGDSSKRVSRQDLSA